MSELVAELRAAKSSEERSCKSVRCIRGVEGAWGLGAGVLSKVGWRLQRTRSVAGRAALRIV